MLTVSCNEGGFALRTKLRAIGQALACAGALYFSNLSMGQTEPADVPFRSDLSLEPDGWYTIDTPDTIANELYYQVEPHRAMFKTPLDGTVNSILRWQEELFDKTGLRIGFRYMSQFQQASGGPGQRSAAADDIDLMFDWTLLGKGTKNTGRFFFSVEDRYRTCEIPPSQLRNEIGSLVGTTGAFSDRGLVVRDAFWDQRLLEDRLRFVIGRAAPDDYAGTHRFQSSVMGFFNGNLSGNVTTPWPGHGPLALVSTRPTDLFYATLGTCNAYSTTTQIQISSLDQGRLFTFGEVGLTPMIQGLGRAQLSVTGWYMPAREDPDRPQDQGISITYQQDIGERLWLMGRYGYADEGLTGVKSAWQVAMAYSGLLGSPDNVTGVGLGYAEPANSDLRDETSIDMFHRFQVTELTQFSVGAQLFFDPSNSPDTDVVAVFSLRLRIDI